MKRTQPVPRIQQLDRLFHALADSTRLRILALLGQDEVCVCHIHDSLGLPQPTVSRHLAYLRRAGMVTARRDGVWMHYRLAQSLSPVIRPIVEATLDALSSLPDAATDRKRFAKTFGAMYVEASADGGSCCQPRAR